MITDELERYFQQRADRDAFSGVVLITQGSSQLFAGTYGYASRTWKTPNRLTTRFDTASVTKLFTAVATLQLIDKGLLAFDTTVVESLGLWDTAISHEVNVYHLLTHTSGIADDAEEENGEDYADLVRTIPNYAGDYSGSGEDPGWLVTGVAGAGGSWPAATAATLALAGQLTALGRMCELCRPTGSKAPKQPLELRSVLSAGCSLPLDPA